MSAETTKVRVNLSDRSYDIEIAAGLSQQAGDWISKRLQLTHAVVITDENVQLHADTVIDSLSENCDVDLLVVDPGEPTKCADVAEQLWEAMLATGADRKSAVVAVGGGVVGDLAGFIAATFARGVPFVQVPTTLLAMVDSSVGGKVGINLPGAKNLVGAFWQPAGVLIDTDFLATLPPREFRAGLAEVVKYGVILDADFFAFLEENVEAILSQEEAPLRHLIRRSCELKAEIVRQDEREETGLRAVLNYGHTFGHALEAVAGYGELLHGEAVSIGMMCAAKLSENIGRVPAGFALRQEQLLTALGLPVKLPQYDSHELEAAMQRDKKVEHGNLRLILPTKLGHVELVNDVPQEEIRKVLVD